MREYFKCYRILNFTVRILNFTVECILKCSSYSWNRTVDLLNEEYVVDIIMQFTTNIIYAGSDGVFSHGKNIGQTLCRYHNVKYKSRRVMEDNTCTIMMVS